jgi:outer membrane lipoprotein-sorting protein
MKKFLAVAVAILFAFGFANQLRAADANPLLKSWLLYQTNIQTWSADFVQTRSLKSFTKPLTSSGHVWFAAPNQFHWELGNPPQTIAVREPEQMLVIYPKLKRVEKYPLGGAAAGPWKDALALLEAGFPRDENELKSRFNIQGIDVRDDVCELTLEPKSSMARRMMSQIKIAFDTKTFLLRATELKFADGSTMRNDFKNPRLNEKLDDALFSPPLDASYKVVEPLKK